jgi:nucleotide-binding universal stress UspA family protein
MFRTILLAVDGSKYAEKAVELAKQLATATNDEVVVTHVTEVLPARFQNYPGLDSELDKETIELAKRHVADLEEAGIKARPELRSAQYGGIARIITNLAEDLDAGLIVMGSHGRGDLTALLLGSVAHKVLHLSRRPVLIAR